MQPLQANDESAVAWRGTGPARDELSHLLAELDAVVAAIEAAAEGSRSLDSRIHFGARVMAGHGHDIAGLLIGEGISWPTVEAALDEAVPRYTGSLDAALDGENIVFVVRSEKRRRWGAMQRSGHEEILAWAATEAMARRLAALKCWRAGIAAAVGNGRDADAVDDPGAAGARSPSDGAASAASATEAGRPAQREEKDWEVLF